MMAQTDQHRSSPPHSTVERLILTILPPAVHRFLFSQSEEFVVTHLILRVLCGALSSTVLFLGFAHSLPLNFDLKLAAGCLFIGVCVIFGVLSSSFRCSVLLIFPSMLGSRGRAYLMVLILSLLYKGPVSNIERNMEGAVLSLSCNLDLQVHHSKLLWREAIKPFILITQNLMDDKTDFESEALSISRKFQTIRDAIIAQYDQFKPQHNDTVNSTQEQFPSTLEQFPSTQEQFITKTRMQCDSVVAESVQRCTDWFKHRWTECMEAISVPVINNILCVSMQFHFLCDVMRVMTPWCREQIPVEGNFGQLYDQLNLSVALLSREFSSKLDLQEEQQQEVIDGPVMDQVFTNSVKRSFQTLTTTMEQMMDIMQVLLSFTFITIFTQAFGYLRRYRRDIRFDNVYITTYFRQIDARRRRAGKRCLLPLRRSEKKKFIDPKSLKIHPEELKGVTSGVFQVLSISVLCFILLTVDFALVHVLDIVSKHTFSQFNLTSSHQVDIRVGGTSMMARLLRTTISAFNSSSSLHIYTDNQGCVSPPSSLSAGVYVSCVCCVLLVALFTCLQVYTNRLRRVIAAFYYPEREKKRVLYFYNMQIQRQISSTDSKHTTSRKQRIGTVFQRLKSCSCCLCCRQRQEESESETHYDPG